MFGSLTPINISSSGMAAERFRMEIVSNNIANAHTTMTETGEPYRRKNVVFSALANGSDIQGVRIVGIEPDPTPFEWVHDPGHPHRDENDRVLLPNVKIPNEMVDLISASRSYEANLRAITLFREMVEETLSLLNGGR